MNAPSLDDKKQMRETARAVWLLSAESAVRRAGVNLNFQIVFYCILISRETRDSTLPADCATPPSGRGEGTRGSGTKAKGIRFPIHNSFNARLCNTLDSRDSVSPSKVSVMRWANGRCTSSRRRCRWSRSATECSSSAARRTTPPSGNKAGAASAWQLSEGLATLGEGRATERFFCWTWSPHHQWLWRGHLK